MHPRLASFLVSLGLAAQPLAGLAEVVIEGVVTLPSKPAAPAPPPRYQPGMPVPAEPDPPMAVVFLEGKFPASTNVPPRAVQLAQRQQQFRPALLPIQRGTLVEFPNLDEFYHNVFSYSKVKRFDLGRYLREEKPAAQRFEVPGVVRLYCEIHEHMRGVILVLDTPHFVKTDAAGHFRLAGLPAGRYTLKAWVEEKDVRASTVELKPGGTLRVNFPAR
jgi:plastocyanin